MHWGRAVAPPQPCERRTDDERSAQRTTAHGDEHDVVVWRIDHMALSTGLVVTVS